MPAVNALPSREDPEQRPHAHSIYRWNAEIFARRSGSIGERVQLITEAVLDEEFEQGQRFAPSGRAVQAGQASGRRILISVLAQADDRPLRDGLEIHFDGGGVRGAIREPLEHEALWAASFQHGAAIFPAEAVRAPIDPAEADLAAWPWIDFRAGGEPAVEALGSREGVVDLMAFSKSKALLFPPP